MAAGLVSPLWTWAHERKNVILKLRPLEIAAFEPFGQVLSWRPEDHVRRNFAARLFNDRVGARPNLRVQHTEPTALPHQATQIERHRHSSQLFAPLSGGSYFVVVFPSDGAGNPLPHEGRAFLAAGNQAINYNVDVWHHSFMAAERAGTFLMLRWEDGMPSDEEFRALDHPVRIES
jgi:ureidoglycolate lyase